MPMRRTVLAALVVAGIVAAFEWSAYGSTTLAKTPPTYGVWAYRIGPGDWSPCNISYVGSLRPSRYDANSNYRLVRIVNSKVAVDAAISQFSKFHQDQPDQVVKLAPCNPATAVVVTPMPSIHSDPIVGTWNWFNGSSVTFFANGKVQGGGGHVAAWVRRGSTYTITWDFGDSKVARYIDSLTLARDGKSLHGKNNEGYTVSASR